MSDIRIKRTEKANILEISVSESPEPVEKILNYMKGFYAEKIDKETIFQKREFSNYWWVYSKKRGYLGNIKIKIENYPTYSLEINLFENKNIKEYNIGQITKKILRYSPKPN